MDYARTVREAWRYLAQEALSARVYSAFLAFLSGVTTYDKAHFEKRAFPVDWKLTQRLGKALANTRRLIIEKPRQMLVSWETAAYAVWNILVNDVCEIGIFAQGELEATELMSKCHTVWDLLPAEFRTKKLLQRTETKLRWHNGLNIEAYATTQDKGKCKTFSILIVDEAAFIEYLPDLWIALLGALDPQAQIIVISTPGKEQNGVFWRLRNHPGAHGFTLLELDWSEHPERDRRWLEKKRKELYAATGSDEGFEREILRKWIARGGQILPGVERCITNARASGARRRITMGCDPHPRQPTTLVWVEWTPAGPRAIGELLLEDDVAGVVEKGSAYEVERGCVPETRVIDRSANVSNHLAAGFNTYIEFCKLNWGMCFGGNDFESNVQLLRTWMRRGLTVDEGACPNLAQQLKSWNWRDRDIMKEKAGKNPYHAIMALVYALQYPIETALAEEKSDMDRFFAHITGAKDREESA